MRVMAIVCLASVVCAFVACGGEAANTPAATPPTGTTASSTSEPATFAEQVTAGQKLYGDKCASCHGAAGEGTKGPRVVGLDKGALPLDPPATAKFRKTQFHTAADVAQFTVSSMPPGAGGSLKESEYWSILAFDLHANGVDLPNKLDGSNAGSVVIHK